MPGSCWAPGAWVGDGTAPPSAVGLALASDWALIDDPVTVTYAPRLAAGGYGTGVTVENAQRASVTKADLLANPGLIQKTTTVFHLWTAFLGGAVPKIHDRVTYAGAVWTVLQVEAMDRDASGPQRYRCITWVYEVRS